MGNYYEGSFRLKLRTIDDELKNILEIISHEDMQLKQEINHPFFKGNYHIGLEYGILIGRENETIEDDNLWDCSFESWEEYKNDEDFQDYSIKGYYIYAYVNRKGYKDELSLLLDFLKSYVPKDLNPLVVGYVYDEDCTCDKDLYLDKEDFEKEQKQREFLCKECDKHIITKLCQNYQYCLRAYNMK